MNRDQCFREILVSQQTLPIDFDNYFRLVLRSRYECDLVSQLSCSESANTLLAQRQTPECGRSAIFAIPLLFSKICNPVPTRLALWSPNSCRCHHPPRRCGLYDGYRH